MTRMTLRGLIVSALVVLGLGLQGGVAEAVPGADVAAGAPTLPDPPVGNLDHVFLTPGAVKLIGWALQPDTIPATVVQVYVDGIYATSETADWDRGDVGAHGFDIDVTLAPGFHEVCVWGMNLLPGLPNTLLGCRVAAYGSNPIGRIEQVRRVPNGVRVFGWALDPDTAASVAIHAYVDGKFALSQPADWQRPDIAGAFPGFGMLHGVDVAVPTPPGDHTVCLYAINVGAGDNTALGCTPVSGLPFGNVDHVITGSQPKVLLSGFAIDPDASTSPTAIHVYVNGQFAGWDLADWARGDLAPAFGFGDEHGFFFEVGIQPFQWNNVCVFAIDQPTSTRNTHLGCWPVWGGNV